MSPIDKSVYDQVLPGMTYEAVAGLFGDPGELVSTHLAQMEPGFQVGSMTTEVYRWQCESGASVQVMFGDGKVRDKSEKGLS